MTGKFMPLAIVLALTFLPAATTATGQEQDGAPGRPAAVPLRVEVTISRHQGDELVSSRPYVLAVTAGAGDSSLRFDDRVPVPVAPLGAGPDGVSRPVGFNYEVVGTHIESIARRRGAGRFEVFVTVEESSVDGDDRTSTDASGVSYPPVFRSFTSINTLVLRDGQSRQYVAAADPLSGETIRVDVTLTVLE